MCIFTGKTREISFIISLNNFVNFCLLSMGKTLQQHNIFIQSSSVLFLDFSSIFQRYKNKPSYKKVEKLYCFAYCWSMMILWIRDLLSNRSQTVSFNEVSNDVYILHPLYCLLIWLWWVSWKNLDSDSRVIILCIITGKLLKVVFK